MSGQYKIQFSANRQPKSARVQRYCVGPTLAVLFCPAPNGKVFGVTIDREDLERVLAAGFWSVANFEGKRGFSLYCYTSVHHKILYLHRFLLDAPPRGTRIEVDHARHRKLDNRRSEIRLVSKSLNQRNKFKVGRPNKHGHRGVLATRSGRYAARVWVQKKAVQLGTFDTPELASERVNQYLLENGAGFVIRRTA